MPVHMVIYLTEKQANLVAEKFMDLGNISLGGMVIAQVFPGVEFSPLIAAAGILSIFTAYYAAYFVMRGGNFDS